MPTPALSACPFCKEKVAVPDELVGRQVHCPYCKCEFTASAPDPSATPRLATPSRSGRSIRFTFTCLRCGSALEAGSELSDSTGRCPTCGATFIVPQVDPHTGLPTGPAVVADDGQLPTPMHAYAAAGAKAPTIRRLPNGDQVIVCPRCDLESGIDANICNRCGLPFTIEGASAVALGAPQNSNSLATTSFVLGLLAIPTLCLPVLGLAAIITGVVAITRTPKGAFATSGRSLAIAGIICGIISLGLGAMYHLK